MGADLITLPDLAALRDAQDENPRAFQPGGLFAQAHLSQRVLFPPQDMPSATGALQITQEFANDQSLTPGAGFTQVVTTGTPPLVSLTPLGARIIPVLGAGLTGAANFLIGLGHYYEEAIILVYEPLVAGVDHRLGGDSGTFHRGRLAIAIESGVARFVWTQADAAGTGIDRFIFDEVPVPLSIIGPGGVRRPIYYRLIRNLPPGGGGKLQLRSWSEGAAYEQTITGVGVPNAVSSGQHTLGGTFGGYNGVGMLIPWWRAQGSDIYPGDTDFGFGDFWAAPFIFTTTQYLSHGDAPLGFLDAGVADVYWHSLSFSTVASFGGGRVRLRWGATNTLPVGSAAGIVSGTPLNMLSYPFAANLNNAQGRYLAIELEFVPGVDAAMGINEAALEGVFGMAAEMGVAEWGFVENPSPDPDLVELGFAGEGAATAVLPFAPSYPVTVREIQRAVLARMEAPYTIARPLGTAVRRQWSARWFLSMGNGAALLEFFAAQGAETFLFPLPESPLTQVPVALVGRVESRRIPPAGYEIHAELVEVFP